MSIKNILIFVCSAMSFLFCAQTSAQLQNQFKLEDVSYLIPLPKNINSNFLQPLLGTVEATYLQKMPRLSMRLTNAQLFPKMFAVSVRIDPKEKHIRAVWQPIVMGANNQVTTLDMAFHSFHQLNATETSALLKKLLQWKKKFPSNKMAHSSLTMNQGLIDFDDIALQELNTLFFSFCRPDNLLKVTAMVLRGNDDMWAFMGVKVLADQSTEPIAIERTNKQMAQAFVNAALPFTFFENVTITGVDAFAPDTLGHFLNQAGELPRMSEEDVKQALDTTYKIENPRLLHEDQLDCVHCHIAQSTQAYIKNKFPEIFEKQKSSFEYKNFNFDLKNQSFELFNTRQIRGFGYFGANPSISQRVVNDSAEAADYVNQNLERFLQ